MHETNSPSVTLAVYDAILKRLNRYYWACVAVEVVTALATPVGVTAMLDGNYYTSMRGVCGLGCLIITAASLFGAGVVCRQNDVRAARDEALRLTFT